MAVESVKRHLTVKEIKKRFPDMFEGMACLPGYCKIKLSTNEVLVVHTL